MYATGYPMNPHSSCPVQECSAPLAGPYAEYCTIHGQQRRRKHAKYIPTPLIDEEIRRAYKLMREFANRNALKLAAKRIGWPDFAVKTRGRALGLARTKEKPWSEREVQALERLGMYSPPVISRKLREIGFNRSATAVHLKRKRMKILSNGDFFSATQLADAFGEDSHKIVRWIKCGLLKAERRGTDRTAQQGGDTWCVLRRDVEAFVLRCPDEFDLAKVEKFWFLDLITAGRICR